MLAPELKAMFYELMIAVCVFAYAASLCDTHAIVIGDDMQKCFHQFATAVLQWWMCQQMIVDPHAIASEDWEATLYLILEKCMSMGTTPASSYCQRAMTEFCLHVEQRFADKVRHKVANLEARYPDFRAYMETRRELSATTGQDEARPAWCRETSRSRDQTIRVAHVFEHLMRLALGERERQATG